MNLRETILAAQDCKREPLNVPEWGVTVWVRTLTGTELDEYQMAIVNAEKQAESLNGSAMPGLRNHRARLVALATVDENGGPVFTKHDIAALGQRNAKALDRIYQKASKLCGLDADERESIAKNSESGMDTGSGSVSRSLLDAPLTSLEVDARPAS